VKEIIMPLIIYFAVISLAAVFLTCSDKLAAKHRPKNRVPEAILFFTAAAGGALAMYISMLIIRHKTQHKRFMIGLPLIILLQVVLLAYLALYML